MPICCRSSKVPNFSTTPTTFSIIKIYIFVKLICAKLTKQEENMKFTLEKKTLLEILTPIHAIIPPRTTLPTLQNVKITAESDKQKKDGRLRFEATDLDVSLSRSLETSVEGDGSVLVSARRLYEIVRELPDLPVHVVQTDFTLVLTCERCVFKLPGSDTEDYPQIPQSPEDTTSSAEQIRLKASALLRAIDKVSFAISTDESRPPLCGLLWQISAKEMKLVATDGHRLALISTGSFSEPPVSKEAIPAGEQASSATEEPAEEKASGESPAPSSEGDKASKRVIVPQKALHLLELLLKPYCSGMAGAEDAGLVIDVGFEESSIGFTFSFSGKKAAELGGSVYVSSRLISGLYPDYASVVPKNNDKVAKVEREELARAIRRVSVFSDPYTHLIKLSLGSGKIGLAASSPQGGEAYDEVACDYSGGALEMGYNANYVLDVLKRIESEQIQIELKSPIDAGVFVPTEQKAQEELLYLLMPIRLLKQ
jgi:DNA polymerase-3 subunit beta